MTLPHSPKDAPDLAEAMLIKEMLGGYSYSDLEDYEQDLLERAQNVIYANWDRLKKKPRRGKA
jgi:hypothetical protein